jgi:5-methylcytosine-specific restriction protein A
LDPDGSTGAVSSSQEAPCLEPHRTTRVADSGTDHPEHFIAQCPTCHRRIHHGIDEEEFNNALISRFLENESVRALVPPEHLP